MHPLRPDQESYTLHPNGKIVPGYPQIYGMKWLTLYRMFDIDPNGLQAAAGNDRNFIVEFIVI